jgi:hypothetical protein
LELAFGTFQRYFEASNEIFWDKKFASIAFIPLTLFYTLRPFQWCKNHLNWSLYAKFMPPTSWPTLLTTMVSSGFHINLITHTCEASYVCNFKNILERAKLNTNWELWHAKTLTLDDCMAMLNIGLLWRRGGSILLAFYLFNSWAKNLGVGFEIIIDEEEDFVAVI